ncbi:hypothetical protein [Sodalis glossinidius]|uniref:hypothetical protein n=1 Tax=Sodalis glossinidius TaxID=63612 RepID=UPI0013054363
MSEIATHCHDDQLQADRQHQVIDKKSKLAHGNVNSPRSARRAIAIKLTKKGCAR